MKILFPLLNPKRSNSELFLCSFLPTPIHSQVQ
jgi:hypothetical protein